MPKSLKKPSRTTRLRILCIWRRCKCLLCRADPIQGAKVNVVGTAVVFEAVKKHADQIQGYTYAELGRRLWSDGHVPARSPGE